MREIKRLKYYIDENIEWSLKDEFFNAKSNAPLHIEKSEILDTILSNKFSLKDRNKYIYSVFELLLEHKRYDAIEDIIRDG